MGDDISYVKDIRLVSRKGIYILYMYTCMYYKHVHVYMYVQCTSCDICAHLRKEADKPGFSFRVRGEAFAHPLGFCERL